MTNQEDFDGYVIDENLNAYSQGPIMALLGPKHFIRGGKQFVLLIMLSQYLPKHTQ